jgi:hypothetical protein
MYGFNLERRKTPASAKTITCQHSLMDDPFTLKKTLSAEQFSLLLDITVP